jgi:integrase
MTFGDAMAVYRERIQSDSNLKPRSKSYRQQTILAISKSWPGIEEIDIRKISKSDCLKWAAAFRQTGTRFRARGAKTDHVGISPERFNNTVGSLRAIFQIAVDAGARYGNPAVEIKKARIRARELKLPTKDQFAAFVREIEGSGAAQAKDCADLVRFLTFTGCRIGEASFLKWEDIDDATSELIVRGDPKTATKNWEIRRIPIIPELRPFLIQLRARRLKGDSTEKILKVRECQKAMDRAANIVKTTRITHHDLRHLFATTCIESGVDIPTVSRWLGHKDGGALAMKVYGHLRNEHSAAQAQRVRFSV